MRSASGFLILMSVGFVLLQIDKTISEVHIQSTISCSCGINGAPIQVPLNNICKTKQHSVSSCKTETESTLCSLFLNCASCDVVNRRCASCSEGRYGSRCSKKANPFYTFQLKNENHLVKRSVSDSWKSLVLGAGEASRSYSQSWWTGGDTPSGLVSYTYTATYSQSAPSQITVVAKTKTGEDKTFSFTTPLTESWFKEKFGGTVPIPKDVKLISSGSRQFEVAKPPQGVPVLNNRQPEQITASQPASDSPWKSLILADGSSSRTYSQSWMTGGDTPSGLVSYDYTATYSQSAPPQIKVTAKSKSGEERTFSFTHPLTESWFKEKFGDAAPIPDDVTILSTGHPQPVKPEQVCPDASGCSNNVASRTFRQWWYSGGGESSRGFVGYNYTAEYSLSSPPKITVIAVSKNGEKTPFHFDKTPSESWFKQMFGEIVSVPNDSMTVVEQPSVKPPTVVTPSDPQLMCPPLVSGEEPSNIGTSKTFHCNDDAWRQVGPSTLICQKDGQWSDKPPTCIPKSGLSECLIPSLSDLITMQMTHLDNGSVVVGTELHLSCKDEVLYTMQGSNLLVCRKSGSWGGQTPTCIPRKYDDPNCGRVVPIAPLIHNGNSVPHSKPWMMFISAGPKDKQRQCGGTLIHRQWVITAAHCLLIHNTEVQNMRVVLDKFNEPVLVERRYIHKRYKLGDYDYDVALLKLTKPVERVGVVPVCLPMPGEDIQPGDKGMAMGRGLFNATGLPAMLQETSLTVVSNEECKTWLDEGSAVHVTNNMFCATATKGLSSVCSGDSGGPMVFQKKSDKNVWTQYGIISWAPEVACNSTEVQYSGMVRVSAVLSWIREYMQN